MLERIALLTMTAGVLALQGQTSLAGRVTSDEEGPMEGVLVSARRAGSSITVTVVSDSTGRYNFPHNRLEPGEYAIRIRAAGYDLEDRGPVAVAAGKAASADLKLRKRRISPGSSPTANGC